MHSPSAWQRTNLFFVCIAALAMAGCQAHQSVRSAVATEPAAPTIDELVWAVNVGGPAYAALDGTSYAAERFVSGGELGTIAIVKGSQDPALYQTYRRGDVAIAYPIANGSYDLTFHFAEPDEIGDGERLFDAFAEGRRVIDDLDVKLFRDGKVKSALTVTAPGVVVSDGELNVRFDASASEPVLSGMVVRRREARDDGWELVWSDDFNGSTLDASRWSARTWAPRKVNDEDQAYTAREKNIRVEDGVLIIEAHREDYEGAMYTSGRVHTQGKAEFLYGRFEVRAKLPRGQGTWPAIWMLPNDPFKYATTCGDGEDWQGSSTCNAWPNSGEIDIMEHVGYQMGHVHGTVHNEAYYWVKWEQRKGRILIDDVADEYHVYALEWSPDRIDVFVDDALYFTYMNEGTGWNAWPYDQPFFVILNIAVGGVWGRSGGPIDDTIFPQQMLVDYVRVYEQTAAD